VVVVNAVVTHAHEITTGPDTHACVLNVGEKYGFALSLSSIAATLNANGFQQL
jgi:hypothetical protein